LSDVARLQTGLALGKSNVINPVKLPYLRVANVQDGYFDLRTIKEVEVSQSEVQRYSLREGDVLFTEGGDADKLGRGAVWTGEVPHCLHQNHVFAVRVDPAFLLPAFLAAFSASSQGKTYFLGCSKQSTNLASINSTQLKAMPLPLPPVPEQREIVTILSAWDRTIELTEKLIAAKRRRKAALMQRLLTGKVRLRDFRDEWVPTKIERILRESRVAGSAGDSARKITVRLHGKGVVPKVETRQGSAETRYYKRLAGQFVYSKLDYLNGAFGIIPQELDGYESTLDLPAFDIGEGVDARWLLYFVTREGFYKTGISLANGGRKARRVNPTDFLRTEIPLPSRSEQTAIADVICSAITEIDLLSRKLDALRRQKKGLMQQLLTGKLRVHVPDPTAE
jgi:type I restriction enzyme S subunit